MDTPATNNDFKLTFIRNETVKLGSTVALSCRLFPEISAVAMVIRWFKGTDCVCLYKDREVLKGRGYEDKVTLLVPELERGNVSLQLRDCKDSDIGYYLCQVMDGDKRGELTLRVWWCSVPSFSRLFESGIPHVCIQQWGRKWLEEERMKMEDSALLTQFKTNVKSLLTKLEEKSIALTKTKEQLNIAKLQQIKTSEELEKMRNKLLCQSTDPESSVEETSIKKELIWKRKSLDGMPPKMSGEDSRPDFLLSVPVPELRLVLLGRTGSGKTIAVNSILGREESSQTATSTVRQQSESRQGEVAGRQVTVVDTPDWFCPGLSLEEVRQDVGHCVRLSAPGPHAFLLVLPVKQSTGEERGMLERMEEIFGERCWRNTMILFTLTDETQKKNVKEFLRSGMHEVRRLLEQCGNWFHNLNIKESGDGSQVSDLLEKIEEMLARNREAFYSSEIYLEIESQTQEMERRIVRGREEMRVIEEKELKEKVEKEVEASLRKMNSQIQVHEEDIRTMDRRIMELKKKTEEVVDDNQKRKLQGELKQEVQQRIEMENIINSLKEEREGERREMEEKHKQEMDKMMEKYEGHARMEAERNLMKIILPELQRNIIKLGSKMQEEFSRQMEEKNREMETLRKRLSELSETHSLRQEVYQSAVMRITETERRGRETEQEGERESGGALKWLFRKKDQNR